MNNSDKRTKPTSLGVWILRIILLNLLYILAGNIAVFFGRLYRGKPTTVENFFLSTYSDWETLINYEASKSILLILVAIGFWCYEKRNFNKSLTLDKSNNE